MLTLKDSFSQVLLVMQEEKNQLQKQLSEIEAAIVKLESERSVIQEQLRTNAIAIEHVHALQVKTLTEGQSLLAAVAEQRVQPIASGDILGKHCAICKHPQRAEIDGLLVKNRNSKAKSIASMFGVKSKSLAKHRDFHIAQFKPHGEVAKRTRSAETRQKMSESQKLRHKKNKERREEDHLKTLPSPRLVKASEKEHARAPKAAAAAKVKNYRTVEEIFGKKQKNDQNDPVEEFNSLFNVETGA